MAAKPSAPDQASAKPKTCPLSDAQSDLQPVSQSDAAGAIAARIEIDHKVRNILQIVASLLSLELRRIGPSGEGAALLRVQARLNSLSLVHGRSSAVEGPTAVRLDRIAAEIAEHLFVEGAPETGTVAVHMALDPVSAQPANASAFALFVNEALMTARDRFVRRRAGGSVSLALRAIGDGASLLSVGAATGARGAGGVDEDEALGALLMASCAAQLGAAFSTERIGDLHEVRLALPSEPPP